MAQWELETEQPGPFDGLTLAVSGRWSRGGVVELRWGGESRTLALPPSLWSVLALLVRKAIQSRADRWFRDFQTTDELARALQRLTVFDAPEPVRYVHRLRDRLEARLVDWPPDRDAGLDWRTLVDTHETLGYGLVVPAERLELVVLDEEPDDVEPA